MFYVIHYDPTSLHQTNEDNNKVYEKNRPIFTVINVCRKYLQVTRVILPMFISFNKLFIQIIMIGKCRIQKDNDKKSLDPTNDMKQV